MNENGQTISTKQAAQIANVTKETIRNWIRDFGIGKKIAGRWIVYKDKLEQVLSGELHYENQGRPKENEPKN